MLMDGWIYKNTVCNTYMNMCNTQIHGYYPCVYCMTHFTKQVLICNRHTFNTLNNSTEYWTVVYMRANTHMHMCTPYTDSCTSAEILIGPSAVPLRGEVEKKSSMEQVGRFALSHNRPYLLVHFI